MWFLLVIFLGWTGGAPQTAEQVAAQLEARMSSLRSLQADFQQTLYASNVSTPLQEQGRLFIRNPGWLRFEYTDPETKVFLIKGNLYYEYYPEDKQLVERTLSEEGSEGALLGLLSGSAEIQEHYSVEFALEPPEEPGMYRIRLTPQEEDPDTYIILEIDAREWLIHKAVSFDWTGNHQEFVFSRVKADIRLPDSLFELKVPPDVDIIR
jgi:outer membrane lipoprotein carrier protein